MQIRESFLIRRIPPSNAGLGLDNVPRMDISPSPASGTSPARPARLALLLILAGLALHVPFLGLADLENDDEARYAQVSQEMVSNGHWVVPYFNGVLYDQKPPAFFWSVALSSLPFGGVSEMSSRLSSAFAGIAMALVVFLLGARLFDPKTGFLAGLLFLLFPQVHEYSTRCRLDLLFSAWIALAILAAYVRAAEGGRRVLSGLALGAFLAFAVLTKGPLGLMLPLVIVPLSLALEGRARRIPAALFSPWALLSLLGLVGGWLLLAYSDPTGGPEYVRRMIKGVEQAEHIKSAFSDTLFFYPKALLGGTAPWCVFLPAAFAWVFSRREGGGRRAFVLPLAWISFCLLAFSLSPQKRNSYILPVYPAFALLLAPVLREAFRAGRTRLEGLAGRLSEIPVWAAAAVAVLAAALAGFWVPRRWPSAAGADVFFLPAILLSAGLLLLFAARRRRVLAIPILAGAVGAAFLVMDGRLDPGESARLSYKPVARAIERSVPRDAPLIAWNCLDNTLPLYLHRSLGAAKDFRMGPEGWRTLSGMKDFSRAYLLVHRGRFLAYEKELAGRRIVGFYVPPGEDKPRSSPGRRSKNPSEPSPPPEMKRDAILILAPPTPPVP